MDDRPMAFTDHLTELRSRLGRSVLVVVVFFFAAYAFHSELFQIVAHPVLQALRNHGIYALQALQVTETITVYIQVSLVAALMAAAPFVFYQIWSFVAPGLYPGERHYVLPIVILTSAFFGLGVVFCYFVFLPMVVDFLVGFTLGSGDITLVPTVQKTFGFTILFPFVFGLLFQLPLLMFFLSLLGVVPYGKFLRFGRYFVVLSFAIGAMFTPPDPLSQALMSVPICLLYFVGVAFAWVAGLLRKEGSSRTLPKVVAGGIILAFAALVIAASYLWSVADDQPSYAAGLPSSAPFVLKANPASPTGRSVLQAAGAPSHLLEEDTQPETAVLLGGVDGPTWLAWGGDFPCPDASAGDGGGCVVLGQRPEVPGGAGRDVADSRFRALDMEKGPVVLVAGVQCLGDLFPFGFDGEGVDGLTAMVTSGRTGLDRLDFVFHASSSGRRAVASWLNAVRDRWVPERVTGSLLSSPLGRVLAWSEGDMEMGETEDAVTLTLLVTTGRASRVLKELVTALVQNCPP